MTGSSLLSATSAAGGIGVAAGIALMLPMEAGVPIPVPFDLVMLFIGARVGAGVVPLWVAVIAFEAVAVIGTTALLLAARGPGHALLIRAGPRVGLTSTRLARATKFFERRGRLALAVGRSTPGLRTLTVVGAGSAGISMRRALPPLILGSSVFVQLHLFLGYFLGSAARHALKAATGLTLGLAVILILAAVAFWLVHRRGKSGREGLLEAACPACLALAAISERTPDLDAVVGSD